MHSSSHLFLVNNSFVVQVSNCHQTQIDNKLEKLDIGDLLLGQGDEAT